MRRTGAGGFTLIELLVVIGIIAVLAAIVIPVYTRAQEKGRQANCISNMHAIAVAIRMYQMDYDAYPQSVQTTFNGTDYTDHYVGYEPVSGTGGISALYHGEYLTDPQVLRCKNDPTTLADYMNRYADMKTTVWEPGDPTALPAVPPTQQTYTDPTILEWGNPNYGKPWDEAADKGAYFREHYSSYNCAPVDPDPQADTDPFPGLAQAHFQLYNYYGYAAATPGLSHNDLTTSPTPDEEYAAGTRRYASTSIKFAGLYNSHAPDTTIIAHCPWHRDFFGNQSAWQDVVVRIGGNVELMRITGYDWLNQPPR